MGSCSNRTQKTCIEVKEDEGDEEDDEENQEDAGLHAMPMPGVPASQNQPWSSASSTLLPLVVVAPTPRTLMSHTRLAKKIKVDLLESVVQTL